MKVSISSVVFAALLGLANAKVKLTNSNFDDIEAGSTFEITWDGAEGPVTLTLKNGPENDLNDVETITTGATGDSFLWPVDSDLPSGNYAIEISDGTDVNYSQMFPVVGTTEPSSTASSTVAATSTSASTSTSTSATRSSTSTKTTSTASSSTESSSTESTTSESTTSSESSTATSSVTSSAESTTAAPSSSIVTRTTSSRPTSTGSAPAQTSVPNTNDAQSMVAPLVPGILAILGVALI